MKYLNYLIGQQDSLVAEIEKLFIVDKNYFCSNSDILEYLKSKNIEIQSKSRLSKIMASFSERAMIRIGDHTYRGFYVKTID